jgi:hypothetical protein
MLNHSHKDVVYTNADKRRFIDSDVQRIIIAEIDNNLINSPQRAQSSQRLILHLLSEIGNMLLQRNGTRMTRIGRIFTDAIDPCVSASSAQSVFYRRHSCVKNPQSAFIFVHPRLINCVGGA